MGAEHDAALDAARAHLDAKPHPRKPLGRLPSGFADTVTGLHVVAEHLLKPKRELETGNEIALGFAPGGFGTPRWERGEASGEPGLARVEGLELVSESGGGEERAPLSDLGAAAELLGLDPGDGALTGVPELDPEAAAALADWFALGTVALAELIAGQAAVDPEPIRLWPEHFDVATVSGDEAAGQRANVGASPGDGDHPEPYLYVGPWDQGVSGEVWNATAFVGAELGHADLLAADDQLGAMGAFLTRRLAALRG